jgi:hypothetical protein
MTVTFILRLDVDLKNFSVWDVFAEKFVLSKGDYKAGDRNITIESDGQSPEKGEINIVNKKDTQYPGEGDVIVRPIKKRSRQHGTIGTTAISKE